MQATYNNTKTWSRMLTTSSTPGCATLNYEQSYIPNIHALYIMINEHMWNQFLSSPTIIRPFLFLSPLISRCWHQLHKTQTKDYPSMQHGHRTLNSEEMRTWTWWGRGNFFYYFHSYIHCNHLQVTTINSQKAKYKINLF